MFKVNNLKKTSSLVVFLTVLLLALIDRQFAFADSSVKTGQEKSINIKVKKQSYKCSAFAGQFDYSDLDINNPCVLRGNAPKLSVLSPDGKRIYAYLNGRLYLFQIEPFKYLADYSFTYGNKASIQYEMFVTDDENYLVLTTDKKIIQYDLTANKVSKSVDIEEGQWVVDSVLNGSDIVFLSSNKKVNDYVFSKDDDYPGNLLIYDAFNLNKKRKIKLNFEDSLSSSGTTPILNRDRLIKLDNFLLLYKAERHSSYASRPESMVVLNQQTYKPQAVFFTKGGSHKISPDLETLYLDNVNKITKYTENGRKNYFPSQAESPKHSKRVRSRPVVSFSLKSGNFSEEIKGSEFWYMPSKNPLPASIILATYQLSKADNYFLGGRSQLVNIKTKQIFQLSLVDQNRALLFGDMGSLSFKAFGDVRKYLYMKKQNGEVVPMNDATFNKFNLRNQLKGN